MKSRSHANRGQPFEELLRFANQRYAVWKLAAIEKMPTEFLPIRDRNGKVVGAKVEQKSKVDFIGRYKHYPIAIEAKHSEEPSIRFDRIEPHQADYMDSFTEEPGTIGLVLLSFSSKHYFAIPWAFWKAAYDIRVRKNDRTTPLSVTAHGMTWHIPRKASVRMDELHALWEVPPHDFTFGLHYLRNVEKYITQQTTKEENPHEPTGIQIDRQE